MATLELWYGGTRMGARDMWSSGSHGYWPNSPASATDVYAYGFSGHQSDGRSFFAERHFAPDEQGDSALHGYLTREASPPAVGDVLNLMLIPRGTRLDRVSLSAFAVPAGFTANLIQVNLSTAVETVLTSLGVADIGVPKNVSVGLDTANVNHMLAIKVTAVATAWTSAAATNWSHLRFDIGASGQDNHNGHPQLDVSQVVVP